MSLFTEREVDPNHETTATKEAQFNEVIKKYQAAIKDAMDQASQSEVMTEIFRSEETTWYDLVGDSPEVYLLAEANALESSKEATAKQAYQWVLQVLSTICEDITIACIPYEQGPAEIKIAAGEKTYNERLMPDEFAARLETIIRNHAGVESRL